MRHITTSILLVLLTSSVAFATDPPVQLYRSAPVSGVGYGLDYTCDLINMGTTPIDGQLRLIDGNGVTRDTQPFYELAPGSVATVNEVTLYANGPRYCQAEIAGPNGEVENGETNGETIKVLGALQTARHYAESIASTPLVLVSENCDDGITCTLDGFNPQTGRCVHQPACPVDIRCVMEYQTRTVTHFFEVAECRTNCGDAGGAE